MTIADDIKNGALLLIGCKIVSDFSTDSSEKAVTCNTLYPDFKKQKISLRNWTFATKKVQLSGKTSLTDDIYLYSYDIPSDMLQLVKLFQSKTSRVIVKDYSIRENKIFSNYDDLYVEYIYDVDESNYSSVYIHFLKYAFASEICFKITGDKVLADWLFIKAYGSPSDNLKGGLFGEASLTDSRQKAVRIIQSSPLINARNSGFR